MPDEENYALRSFSSIFFFQTGHLHLRDAQNLRHRRLRFIFKVPKFYELFFLILKLIQKLGNIHAVHRLLNLIILLLDFILQMNLVTIALIDYLMQGAYFLPGFHGHENVSLVNLQGHGNLFQRRLPVILSLVLFRFFFYLIVDFF